MQGGMRQPAGAAERRRGQEGAPRGEAGGLQSFRPLVENSVDPWRERGALDRAPSVALDERDDDVLAAQAGQQLVAGGVAEAVAPNLIGEDLVVVESRPDRTYLVDSEAGGARGGDWRVRDELGAEHPTDHPDDAKRRDGPKRPAAVDGRDTGQAKHRQGREDEDGDAEQRRTDDGQVRVRPTDRVAQRLDADPGVAPVTNGVERPVEGRKETEVEDLHEDQQTESRPDDPGQGTSRGGGQGEGQRDDDEALERDPQERAGREPARLVRSYESDPHEQNGENREHCRDTCSHVSAPEAAVSGRSTVRGVPVAPQPPHVAAERLGKQTERGDECGLGQSRREDVSSRDR